MCVLGWPQRHSGSSTTPAYQAGHLPTPLVTLRLTGISSGEEPSIGNTRVPWYAPAVSAVGSTDTDSVEPLIDTLSHRAPCGVVTSEMPVTAKPGGLVVMTTF